jgi:tryptophan-rich sensory protein
MGQLKALKRPGWSPPNWVWVLIGIAWYGICFTGLIRLLPLWPEHKLTVILLVALMLANGAANMPLLRLRRLDLALVFFVPYWVLLAAFLWTACSLDGLTCALFAGYAVYQFYAAVWGYQLLRMNRSPASGTEG